LPRPPYAPEDGLPSRVDAEAHPVATLLVSRSGEDRPGDHLGLLSFLRVNRRFGESGVHQLHLRTRPNTANLLGSPGGSLPPGLWAGPRRACPTGSWLARLAVHEPFPTLMRPAAADPRDLYPSSSRFTPCAMGSTNVAIGGVMAQDGNGARGSNENRRYRNIHPM